MRFQNKKQCGGSLRPQLAASKAARPQPAEASPAQASLSRTRTRRGKPLMGRSPCSRVRQRTFRDGVPGVARASSKVLTPSPSSRSSPSKTQTKRPGSGSAKGCCSKAARARWAKPPSPALAPAAPPRAERMLRSVSSGSCWKSHRTSRSSMWTCMGRSPAKSASGRTCQSLAKVTWTRESTCRRPSSLARYAAICSRMGFRDWLRKASRDPRPGGLMRTLGTSRSSGSSATSRHWRSASVAGSIRFPSQ
mmetsp:Transcript_38709/g.123052  ORF Transcript_38709/g.123052 Transcript_38709/m.123052 type:complete len:250 (+) Transcript_38709:291-1040(+)